MDDLDALLRTLEIFTHLVYIPDKLIDKVKHSCAKSDLKIQRLLTSALEIDDDPDEYGATVSSILTCIGQLTLHLLEYALYTMDWISKFNPAHVHEEYIHGLCCEAEE